MRQIIGNLKPDALTLDPTFRNQQLSEDALVFVLELQVSIIGGSNCTNVSVFQTHGNNGPYRGPKKKTSNTGRADSALEDRWETQNSPSVFQSFSPNTGFVSGATIRTPFRANFRKRD